jgi:hypothetical protein
MQRKIAVITTLIVTALGVSATPAAAATTSDDVVQRTIQSKTGRGAAEVSRSHLVDGLRVGRATRPAGALPTFVQDRPDGFAVMAVLNAGQDSATFNGLLKPGQRFEPNADGGLAILAGDNMVGYVEKPWALDATGKGLTTKYVISGGAITQEADTRGATFPIVADPSVKLGIHIVPVAYLQYTWTETWWVRPYSVWWSRVVRSLLLGGVWAWVRRDGASQMSTGRMRYPW